ncbi:EamA family transporter [Bosea sp. LjRoot90]|uniref:EamA family transporter n=1 Tax=Bosea sp. LjRoot90 TaxID=3342342 RepID=UPI003ECD4CCA
MTLGVFLAVLAAAAMHAGWNAFVKIRLEPLLAMTMITSAAGVLALPALAVTGLPRIEAWPWLLGSVIFHVGYYIGLAEAYRRAEMSQIYPLARGSAPLLTTAIGISFFGEKLAPLQLGAIAVLGLGIMLISILGRRRGSRFDPIALGFAALAAVMIAAYTLVDGLGARAAGDPHAYSAALFVIDALPLAIFVAIRRGRPAWATMKPYWLQGSAGGTLALGAYWIAIWAMTVAPIPLVAALRESSVLFAAVIAFVWLKEPLQPSRLLACGLILISLALMRIA